MSTSHEHIYPEITDSAEKPEETVERFLQSSRHIFRHVSSDLDTKWHYQIDTLFGHEELRQVDRNDAYIGIPGARAYLISECKSGGLLGLEVAFINKVYPHTKDAQITEDAIRTGFKKILDFK